jgi:4-hydroxybenzoate polyprenyltransferase
MKWCEGRSLVRALRPAQWIKNSVVIAAWFFARWDPGQRDHILEQSALLQVVTAVCAFCMVSSAVYLINDLHDIDVDRLHPIKKSRPLAAGEISKQSAVVVALLLLLFSFTSALLLPLGYIAVLAGYVVMQLLYTFFLKRIAFVDIFVIAIGFVMRAVAGALALTVRISPWLLLCTFLLSLFLALCKRRHEKTQAADSGSSFRETLAGYDIHVLDIQIGVTAASTLVCYAMYTLSSDTIERFGTSGLGLTIPFVVFGIFRYLDLVYTGGSGGRPEKVLLGDKIMIITILCFAAAALAVFWCANRGLL